MNHSCFDSLIFPAADRLVQDAMSGKYLDGNFSLPCPPGLRIPPEVISPFTSNNLKVNTPERCYTVQCCVSISVTKLQKGNGFKILTKLNCDSEVFFIEWREAHKL